MTYEGSGMRLCRPLQPAEGSESSDHDFWKKRRPIIFQSICKGRVSNMCPERNLQATQQTLYVSKTIADQTLENCTFKAEKLTMQIRTD